MPRDGSGYYTVPSGTDGIPGTTIASTPYNLYIHDVETDLNAVRPIIAGGTGATNAATARANIKAEISNQVVTNYDTQVWEFGSFSSAASATSAPVAGHAFAGMCYGRDANNVVLEARDLDDTAVPGIVYVREKTAGVWSAWTLIPGSTAGQYVLKAGDSMTGTLTLNGVTNALLLTLHNTSDATNKFFAMGAGGSLFIINSANTNILATFADSGNLSVAGSVTSGSLGATGGYLFGNTGTKSLIYDGTNYTLAGGRLAVSGDILANAGAITATSTITAGSGGITGGYLFGNTTTKSLAYDGTNFSLSGGKLFTSSDVIAIGSVNTGSSGTTGTVLFGNTGVKTLTFSGTNFDFAGGGVSSTSGYANKQGASGGFSASVFNFYYNAGPVQCWIDTTNLGNLTLTSDYRIKKDVTDLPSTWDTVKALRPIRYTQAEFTPPSHKQYVAEQVLRARAEAEAGATPKEVNTGPLFPSDSIERWGFIAHELQETLVESAATGVKDAPDTIQSPNPFTVIAALTRALQEAMARIEALEATVAA